MSFSETFAVLGLVAAGLVALAFYVSEPPLEQVTSLPAASVEVESAGFDPR
ncbi:MAG: hypothetical protein QNK04_32385 [Myxococcota bacterium]|nr:hypothetical protein [Myxococcota bacterium]